MGTKMDAADDIAVHVRVAARKAGATPNRTMVEELLSEFRAGHRGPWLARVAADANPRTTLRLALAGWDE